MEQKNIFDVFANVEKNFEFMPFAKTWRKTFECIEACFDAEKVNEETKDKVLTKIVKIVKILVEDGDTYEDIVINTAQLYIFAKEFNFSSDDISSLGGRFVAEGVKTLLTNDIKAIFENKDMLYLGKIKIAELVVKFVDDSLSEFEKTQIENILNFCEGKTHKGLFCKLKQLKNNIGGDSGESV